MIGDVLTTTVLFELIKNHFEQAEIHYVINTNTKAVVEDNPYIDVIHEVSPETTKSLSILISFSKGLKSFKFDYVIDAYGKLSSNIMTLFSGGKTKISKYKWYTSFLYDHAIKYDDQPKGNNGLAIENRLQLLAPLGITEKDAKPKLYLKASEIEAAKELLMQYDIDLSKPLFMISVLGSGSAKTYPFDYMAKVLDTLVATSPNAQLLFNYIPNQKEDAKAIFDACNKTTQQAIVFELFGKSLREFMALTHHCTALIGNEGGAINMAKALDIPTFAIFSPWIDKKTWNLFEDDIKYMSVHLSEYWPEVYKDHTLKTIKEKVDYHYKLFKPELFEDKLKSFIKNVSS